MMKNERNLDMTAVKWFVRMAETCLERWPILSDVWSYEPGVVLKGLEQIWLETGEEIYGQYIKRYIDQFVNPDGSIRTYNLKEYNLDQINTGKVLFELYRVTGEEKYRKALDLLIWQLKTQPRTREGGFWHKKIYPYQMWLDGIYMAAPFYVQFAQIFNSSSGFDDAVHQILLIERNTHDSQTGLNYHGWDESRLQSWANPETGCSPNFWGRSIGWYVMALVDVLDYLPESYQARNRILSILIHLVESLVIFQDDETGLWYQVLDRGKESGNYLEASASCMFVYGLGKGIRKGYLPFDFLKNINKAYAGILDHLVEIDEKGLVHLTQICSVAGLGGERQRDGSYQYYVNEPIVANDMKGVGAFLLCSIEVERLNHSLVHRSV